MPTSLASENIDSLFQDAKILSLNLAITIYHLRKKKKVTSLFQWWNLW